MTSLFCQEGDLAGVAGRWMLAGQLRRVAEERGCLPRPSMCSTRMRVRAIPCVLAKDAALLVLTKREQSQDASAMYVIRKAVKNAVWEVTCQG